MRVAVVVPRYGSEVLGGAETLARGFVEEAVRQGWEVEIWTTCARSHYTWENVYLEGCDETRNGVVVRRFPITCLDLGRQADLDMRLAAQGHLTVVDQYAWLENGPHSVPLYEYISQHADEFEVVVALPYAIPLIHYAVWAAPERTVVWPCLHNEPYAYLEPVRLLLESCWGVMFNSPEEQDLAIRRLGIRPRYYAVLGEGVTSDLLLQHNSNKELSPYLLYVGRLEEGKNVGLLYDYMRRYVEEEDRDLRLVVVGDGPSKPPLHPAFEFRGFVSDQEKAAAYTSALLLCQPSLNESFSLVIMESWLAGRPVLVHGECAVTRGHVKRSKGGLWFYSYEEFAGAIAWFRAHPGLASRMGQNGRQYVLRNYSWETVIARFERLVRRWKGEVG